MLSGSQRQSGLGTKNILMSWYTVSGVLLFLPRFSRTSPFAFYIASRVFSPVAQGKASSSVASPRTNKVLEETLRFSLCKLCVEGLLVPVLRFPTGGAGGARQALDTGPQFFD